MFLHGVLARISPVVAKHHNAVTALGEAAENSVAALQEYRAKKDLKSTLFLESCEVLGCVPVCDSVRARSRAAVVLGVLVSDTSVCGPGRSQTCEPATLHTSTGPGTHDFGDGCRGHRAARFPHSPVASPGLFRALGWLSPTGDLYSVNFRPHQLSQTRHPWRQPTFAEARLDGTAWRFAAQGAVQFLGDAAPSNTARSWHG